MWPAELAIRPHDQHHRHDQEFGNQCKLGEIDGDQTKIDDTHGDTQGLHFRDDHRCEIGAGDRAHAADNHHNEGVADGDQVGGKIGGLARDLQRSAKSGECCAKRKYRGKQNCLIDPQRADHFAVLCRRAHQAAEARACKC